MYYYAVWLSSAAQIFIARSDELDIDEVPFEVIDTYIYEHEEKFTEWATKVHTPIRTMFEEIGAINQTFTREVVRNLMRQFYESQMKMDPTHST